MTNHQITHISGQATGVFCFQTKKMTLFKNSLLSINLDKNPSANIAQNYQSVRDYLEKGWIVRIDGSLRVERDIPNLSLSAAGVFVTGRSGSGWFVWLLENGMPVDVLRKNNTDSAQRTVAVRPQQPTKHRYKLFEVEAATHLPGHVRIMNDERPIGKLLRDLIQAAGGACSFGVECSSFAWFLADGYYHLLLHEDDANFNVDLAMNQLVNLPGRPPMDFFESVKARMTIPCCTDLSAGVTQGMNPTAMGPKIPHEGMAGQLFRSNNPQQNPLLVAPDLPCLDGADPATAGQLIDDWFRQMQDVLRDLKKRFGGVNVFFKGGGTVPIPDWFRDWCNREGINITVGDGPPCDLDIQTNNNDRKFVEFWQAIKNLGPEGGVCPSQGRGAPVKYYIEDDHLILISEGRNPNAKPMGTTKHTANVWFNKLQNGMTPFGNGGFRYNHSAWFHDVYVAILAN